MTLPPTFQFSQNSLQDYVDCPRRFQLRYLLRQPWPAVESEPLSEYEHKDHPLLGYSSSLYEPEKQRFLMYVEILDGEYTKQVGLNETVERVLVYESFLT